MTRSRSLLCTALITAAPLAAQQPYTLPEAVAGALATHPSVAAAEASTAATVADVRRARSAWWPAASLDASATGFEEPMVVAPLHGFDPANPPRFDDGLWQANLSLSWALLDPARGPRIGRAEAEADAAQAGSRATRDALVARTVAAFLDVTTARDLLAFHEARLGALRRELARARLFVREGRAARLAQLRAEAALTAAEAERLLAAGRLETAERALERLTGDPSGSVTGRPLARTELAAMDTVPGRAQLLEAAEAGNPELAGRSSRITAARAARSEARAAWLPEVRLVGRLVQYGSGGGAESTEWQGGVAISYPLFTGGARPAAADRASAALAAAVADEALTRRQLGDAVDRALAGYLAARGRVEAFTAAVRQAEEVARMERLALDGGAGVQTDYLAAEADLLRVRGGLGEAQASLINARVELARLAGGLTPAWLGEHLEHGQ